MKTFRIFYKTTLIDEVEAEDEDEALEIIAIDNAEHFSAELIDEVD